MQTSFVARNNEKNWDWGLPCRRQALDTPHPFTDLGSCACVCVYMWEYGLVCVCVHVSALESVCLYVCVWLLVFFCIYACMEMQKQKKMIPTNTLTFTVAKFLGQAWKMQNDMERKKEREMKRTRAKKENEKERKKDADMKYCQLWLLKFESQLIFI